MYVFQNKTSRIRVYRCVAAQHPTPPRRPDDHHWVVVSRRPLAGAKRLSCASLRSMETFVILGVCFLCYEIFEYVYLRSVNGQSVEVNAQDGKSSVFSIKENEDEIPMVSDGSRF